MRAVQNLCEHCISAYEDGDRGTGSVHGIVCLCGPDVAADRKYQAGYADAFLRIVDASRTVFRNYPNLMAGSVLAMVPMIVIYLIFQKQFIEGIALTGTKA